MEFTNIQFGGAEFVQETEPDLPGTDGVIWVKIENQTEGFDIIDIYTTWEGNWVKND